MDDDQTYMAECLENINNPFAYPKLRTYKLFKNEFKFENYLYSTKNINHTLSLFRFRISSHNLRIETGRYTRPKMPEHDRICIYGTQQSVETEQHFLLVCDLYNNEKSELLNSVIRHSLDLTDLTNEEKFIMLMANKDKLITDALGKYIFMCLKKRSSLATIRDNHQNTQSNQSVQVSILNG